MHAETRGEPAGVVDRLDDVRRLCPTALANGVCDGDPAEMAEVRQEVWDVEDRSNRLAPAGLSDEGKVGDRQRQSFLERRHPAELLEARAAPAGPVDDEAIGHFE